MSVSRIAHSALSLTMAQTACAGAFEFQPDDCAGAADLSGDGIVGPSDLTIVLGNWG